MYRLQHKIPLVASIPLALTACGAPGPPGPVHSPGVPVATTMQNSNTSGGSMVQSGSSNCMTLTGVERFRCSIEQFCEAYQACFPHYTYQTVQQCTSNYMQSYRYIFQMGQACINAYAALFECQTSGWANGCRYQPCYQAYQQIYANCWYY